MNIYPLIEKIHLLESKIRSKQIYTLLNPFKFDSSDYLKVQEVGKIIAQHIGLPPMTFIITYAAQREKVGGHIQIDNSNEVFIEINNKFKHDCDLVLSILAHELCHKYLQLENLKCFPEFENEILTDAATIFTGLGKLSLNGCEKINISSEIIDNTINTSTSTQKVGYMNRQQFAFIYRLMCEMRRIPKDEMLQGLSQEAYSIMQSISFSYAQSFNQNYFSNTYTLNKISEVLNNEIRESQKSFATFQKDIRIIQENILVFANKTYRDYHSSLKKRIEKLNANASETHNKETHNYIKNLFILENLEVLKLETHTKDINIKDLRNEFSKFVKSTSKAQDLNFLFMFECPTCSNKIRILQKMLAKVKCLNCNYSFIVDTGAETIEIPIINSIKAAAPQKKGMYKKMVSLFNKAQHTSK